MRFLKMLKFIGFFIIWSCTSYSIFSQDYSFGDKPCQAPMVEVAQGQCLSFQGLWDVRNRNASESLGNFDQLNNDCSGNKEENFDGWLKFQPVSDAVTFRLLEQGSLGTQQQHYALYIYRSKISNGCPQDPSDLELMICSTSESNYIHESFPVSKEETYYARLKPIYPKVSNELSIRVCIQSLPIFSRCSKESNFSCNASGPFDSIGEIAQNDGFLGNNGCPNILGNRCTDFCDINNNLRTGITGPKILEYCFEVTTDEKGTLGSLANMNGDGDCLTNPTWYKNINTGIGMILYEIGAYDKPMFRDSLLFENGYKLHVWYGLKPNHTYKICHYISIPQPLCTITRYCPRFYYPEPSYDCAQLQKNFGDSCDDQIDATENDIITIDCNCAGTERACPTSDHVSGPTQYLCNGDTPSLPKEGLDFRISDPSGTRLSDDIHWFEGGDPLTDSPFNLASIEHSGSDLCTPDPIVKIFGFVECDQDLDGLNDKWVQVAEHSYQVFPDIQAPTVVRENDNCSYRIVAGCRGDGIVPASLPDLPPGSAASTVTISVSSGIINHPCGSKSFEIEVENCPEQLICPSSDFTSMQTQHLCSGQTPILPKEGGDFSISDPSSTRLGDEVTWFAGDTPDIDEEFVLEAKQHSGLDLCAADAIVQIFGFVPCDQDLDGVQDSWVQVATHSYQVFPEILTPSIVRINNECSYSITPGCTSDVVDPLSLPDRQPGSIASTVSITLTSGIADHPCGSKTFEVMVEGCPATASCPTSDFTPTSTQYLCSGEIPDLPAENTDFRISDPSETRLGSEVVWFEGSDPDSDSAFDLGAKDHSGIDMCSADPIVEVFGFIECDQDGVRDSWIEVATYGYQVFPEIEAPSVVRQDNSCSYAIVAECGSDVIDPSSLPNQLPGSISSLKIITVSSGIPNHPCDEETFEVKIEACPSSATVEVFFPKAFTPNDDYLNDRFKPILDVNHYPEVVQFLIFNRWGEVIFVQENLSSENSSLGWNGRLNEKPMYTGSYVYKVVLSDKFGRQNTFSGKVLLIK